MLKSLYSRVQGGLSPALVTLIVGRDVLLVGGSFAYRAATIKPGVCLLSGDALTTWRMPRPRPTSPGMQRTWACY